MARFLVLGNGNMLVCMDRYNQVKDWYYPHVGQENHVSGHTHRIGVFVDGKFAWLSDPSWKLDLNYKKESMVSNVSGQNSKLGVSVSINDAVHHDKNVFLREANITNSSPHKRRIKLFFSQHFHISEANIGDTVYYNPIVKSIINYKGKRYFLTGGQTKGRPFDDYATGVGDERGREGTYVDAHDGHLSKNPIEHGSVDSTIGFTLDIPAGKTQTVYYWVCVGKRHNEVAQLREYVLKKGVKQLISDTDRYWKRWVNKKSFMFLGLNDRIRDLFKRSLLVVKANTDHGGAIIAANDTGTFQFKKDTYSYMWPRDGALVARSLDRVGHKEMTEQFFRFCAKVAHDDGYLAHKYRPDGSMGSSWHSWLKGDKIQLPIQEDETALLLDALWKRFKRYNDEEFIEELYKDFIKPAGDFLVDFRDKKTKLPKETYDLWEEKLGVHTFTCSTVYAGLRAAMHFAQIFGSSKDAKKYEKAAKEVQSAIVKYLYCKESNCFIKRMYYDDDGEVHYDHTIDISTGYGIFEFKVLPVDDPRVKSTMELIEKTLQVHEGGLARYQGDMYYRVADGLPGNPWFISTLWMVEYYVTRAKKKEDLEIAEDYLEWVANHALSTGVLAEQIHPFTGEPLSVSPLTWSHSAFVVAVVKYLDKLEELGVCEPYVCYPPRGKKYFGEFSKKKASKVKKKKKVVKKSVKKKKR